MIKHQKIVMAAALMAAILTALFQAQQAHHARAEAQELLRLKAESAKQITDLQNGLADKSNELVELLAKNSRSKNDSSETELLKLRGEVTRLRPLQEDVVALQKLLRQSSGGLAVWKTNEITDAGRANPIDAVQTFIYSSQKLDISGMQNSFVGDDADPPPQENFQSFMNDTNNLNFGDEVASYKVLSETWLAPNKVQVELNVSGNNKTGFVVPITLRNINGEWKLVVFNIRDQNGNWN